MLAKTWIEEKLYTLLAKMQSSPDTMEINIEVSEMGKNGVTIWLSYPTPEYLQKGLQIQHITEMHINDYCMYNSCIMEPTQVANNWRGETKNAIDIFQT